MKASPRLREAARSVTASRRALSNPVLKATCLARIRQYSSAAAEASSSSEHTEPLITPPPPTASPSEGSSPLPTPEGDEGNLLRSKRSRMKARTSKADVKFADETQTTRERPVGVEIWSPTEEHSDTLDLPSQETLEEALNHLRLALHPHNQIRAINSSEKTRWEPSLALYCPIDGGNYVVDATVRQMAYKTNSDVIVIDGLHLLAGQWGRYMSTFQLSHELLRFCPPEANSDEAEVDDDSNDVLGRSIQTLAKHLSATTSSAPQVGDHNLKIVLDALVNTKVSESANDDDEVSPRPRIIYVRDVNDIQAASSAWYLRLLQAIFAWRIGDPTMSCPIAIVFGVTPPYQPMPGVVVPANSKKDENWHLEWLRDWGLREKLRSWETGMRNDDIPYLTISKDASQSPPTTMLAVGPIAFSIKAEAKDVGDVETEDDLAVKRDDRRSSFFRTTLLLPSKRSKQRESDARQSKRQTINELLLRSAIGSVGGALTTVPFSSEDIVDFNHKQWTKWMTSEQTWTEIREVADKALGSAMSVAQSGSPFTPLPQNPTTITWSELHRAISPKPALRDQLKSWIKSGASEKYSLVNMGENKFAVVEDSDKSNRKTNTGQERQEKDDLVLQRVKNEKDLTDYERRLLPCIVNTAHLPTSFGQIHLPVETIDAIRTIVSLPLLHPEPFRTGILKENRIKGALLFGPPGVGKTLLARALAKEAGCRMMIVRASDINDQFVGESEKLIKAVFELARRLSPCILFLDEIDSLLGQRGSTNSGGGLHHRACIVEWMQEMDGLRSSSDEGVFVLGATNRPYDLDDAVLRRLPRRLMVDLPGESDREEILKILLRDETLGTTVDLKRLSQDTETYSGSDLKNLCVAATLVAVKEKMGDKLPWSSKHAGSEKAEDESDQRELTNAHFEQALKEITPSSSEFLGSIAELRKWNDAFGEGSRRKKRVQVWGKDRFGFVTTSTPETLVHV